MDETQGVAIAEEPDRHAALAQESLEFLVRRGHPAAMGFGIREFVQRLAGRQHLHEKHPRLRRVGRFEIPVGGGWLQHLAIVAGGNPQAIGHLGRDGEN